MRSTSKRVLFIGTGVIGSVYAGKLARAGHEVSVMDRGSRRDAVREHGIVLRQALTGVTEQIPVRPVEMLHDNDPYDLIVVPMRADQVDEVIPMLAANQTCPSVLLMVNNPDGYERWISAIGDERLLIGFPGAGGTVVGNVVEYTIVSPLLQPTTFGPASGTSLQRPRELASMFRQAGFPTAVFRNMDAWQKYHVAWVTPLAIAIYRAHQLGASLADRPELLRSAIRSIREGFRILGELGYAVSPGKLRLLSYLPEDVLFLMFRTWARTRHFDTVAVRHCLNAFDEMRFLANRFKILGRSIGSRTPALDHLYAGI